MTRRFAVQGIRIYAQATGCAHACRYCLVEQRRFSRVPFDRFEAQVARFIDWRRSAGRDDVSMLVGFENSYEFDVEILARLFALLERIGWSPDNAGVKLGGLKLRSDTEARAWLAERRDRAGMQVVHASLAGFGATHDRWNGRAGDFDHLLRMMAQAADLGVSLRQRLFVVKSTLPDLEGLLAKLDALQGEAFRYLSTFAYQGRARRLEDERIDEAERDALPGCLHAMTHRHGEPWLSEREWLHLRREDIDSEPPEGIHLDLELTEANFARYEEMGCAEIFEALGRDAAQKFAPRPGLAELRDKYGDPSCKLVYGSLRELEAKWLDLAREDRGA